MNLDDTPNTQAEPVPATVITIPTAWLALGENYAEILVKRIDVTAVDFYLGNP